MLPPAVTQNELAGERTCLSPSAIQASLPHPSLYATNQGFGSYRGQVSANLTMDKPLYTHTPALLATPASFPARCSQWACSLLG